MCGPHFCSMRISQDVRTYAAEHGIEDDADALDLGMRQKSAEFLREGARVYLPVVEGEHPVTPNGPAGAT